MADSHGAARRLVLVRHAKAGNPVGTGDKGRPLTDRGRGDASAAGAWLGQQVPRVDAIWSSSATRARETADAMRAGLPDPPQAQSRDELYEAGPGDVVDLLAELDDEAVVVVVGHNPTIEALHDALSGDRRGFRPGAVSVLELSTGWDEVTEGSGRLLDFWAPS
jgi:phosphohistidine phosphatase